MKYQPWCFLHQFGDYIVKRVNLILVGARRRRQNLAADLSPAQSRVYQYQVLLSCNSPAWRVNKLLSQSFVEGDFTPLSCSRQLRDSYSSTAHSASEPCRGLYGFAIFIESLVFRGMSGLSFVS